MAEFEEFGSSCAVTLLCPMSFNWLVVDCSQPSFCGLFCVFWANTSYRS